MTQVTYIGDPDLAFLLEKPLEGTGIEFSSVDTDSLNSATLGDVFITERTIRFEGEPAAKTDLGEIVNGIRERIGRAAPIIIFVSKSEELSGLEHVRTVIDRIDLPRVISELLQEVR